MPHWACRLSAAHPHRAELKWLGPDGGRIRTVLGDGAAAWAVEVGEVAATKMAQEIPPLGESVYVFDALRRATTSTTLRALTLVSGCGEGDTSLASPESLEMARDLARRGMDLSEFFRAIRVGHAVLATAFFEAVTNLVPVSDLPSEFRNTSMLLFETIDDFIAVVTTAFRDEQRLWGASIAAAQYDLAKRIVEGEQVDLLQAEKVLCYPLAGRHRALIAGSVAGAGQIDHDLREVINRVLRCWGFPSASLVIPVGSNTVWAWAAVSSEAAHEPGTAPPEFDGIHIVAGQIGSGVEGFRRTHLEARAVEGLVRLRSSFPHATIAHEDVDLDVLLLADQEAARQFIAHHLGPLATDDPRMGELRSTLRRYLDMDHSLAKVAAAEHISRNTVTYRVQQALRICAHPKGTPTTKLRAALVAADWLVGSLAPH